MFDAQYVNLRDFFFEDTKNVQNVNSKACQSGVSLLYKVIYLGYASPLIGIFCNLTNIIFFKNILTKKCYTIILMSFFIYCLEIIVEAINDTETY